MTMWKFANGEKRDNSHLNRSHIGISLTDLNIVDFERAGKVTGSRFVFYHGLGARLERALYSLYARCSYR